MSDYTSIDRVNDILDKILKYGLSSITNQEGGFLDSHSRDLQEDFHNFLLLEEVSNIFEDFLGYFKFELHDVEIYEDGDIHYLGTLYVPDLIVDGKVLEGRLEGRIILYDDGVVSPDFYYMDSIDDYDVFDFCDGIEYELDSFLDYIISEIKTEENEN